MLYLCFEFFYNFDRHTNTTSPRQNVTNLFYRQNFTFIFSTGFLNNSVLWIHAVHVMFWMNRHEWMKQCLMCVFQMKCSLKREMLNKNHLMFVCFQVISFSHLIRIAFGLYAEKPILKCFASNEKRGRLKWIHFKQQMKTSHTRLFS